MTFRLRLKQKSFALKSAKKAGISDNVANFALPLGAIFNSDGGAIRMGVSIVFAANITNLQLSAPDLFMIVLVGTLLSIGTAGVPAGWACDVGSCTDDVRPTA